MTGVGVGYFLNTDWTVGNPAEPKERAMTIPEQAVEAAAKADCCPDCDCIPTASYCPKTNPESRGRIERILAAAQPLMGFQRTEDVARDAQDAARRITHWLFDFGWTPRRSHIESARNDLQKIADALLALPRHTGQPQAGWREALEFYSDPVAWKKLHDPEDDIRVPDFYDETSFGDTAKAALSASPPPVAESGWQEIESAPKDGTPIDLWGRAGRHTNCRWGRHDEDSRAPWGEPHWRGVPFYREHGIERQLSVTHWRPLPAPPHIAEKRPEVKP